MDGLKLYLEQSGSHAIQNTFYNCWKHDHHASNIFLFAHDGMVQAMVINVPGSTHDSTAAEFGLIYDKLQTLHDKCKSVAAECSSSISQAALQVGNVWFSGIVPMLKRLTILFKVHLYLPYLIDLNLIRLRHGGREREGGVGICMTVSCNTVSLAIARSIASSSLFFNLSSLLGVTKLEGDVEGDTERDDGEDGDVMDDNGDFEPVTTNIIIIIIIIIKLDAASPSETHALLTATDFLLLPFHPPSASFAAAK
eukprot:4080884-Ditylum_brightwellii.AAC.1